jgi:Tfp pilus assembly protein PilZ
MTDSNHTAGQPTIAARLKVLLKSIYRLIDRAPEHRQRALLILLEAWHFQGLLAGPKKSERREHSRKRSRMAVTYGTRGRVLKDFIKNISDGGVFIETGERFSVGQEITLVFSSPNPEEEPVKMIGEVMWNASEGVGVKFRETRADLTKRMGSP